LTNADEQNVKYEQFVFFSKSLYGVKKKKRSMKVVLMESVCSQTFRIFLRANFVFFSKTYRDRVSTIAKWYANRHSPGIS